jgi:hypothetical protein
MIRRVLARAAALAVAGVVSCAFRAAAATEFCPGSIPPNSGNVVGGNTSPKYDVVSASALNAVSPNGDVTFQAFGYLYTTRAGGAYIEDGHPHGWIVPVAASDTGSILKALAKLQHDLPPSQLSDGAKAVLTPGWNLTVLTCTSHK